MDGDRWFETDTILVVAANGQGFVHDLAAIFGGRLADCLHTEEGEVMWTWRASHSQY